MTRRRHSRMELEVRYAETDQMGVVHHANYLVWFEQARTRLCADAGHHYAEIERQGHMILVTGAQLSYRAGARYGDTVTVECRLDRLASRAMRFGYRVLRDDQLLVSGITEHIWVDGASRRPGRIPSPFREAFESLLPANAVAAAESS